VHGETPKGKEGSGASTAESGASPSFTGDGPSGESISGGPEIADEDEGEKEAKKRWYISAMHPATVRSRIPTGRRLPWHGGWKVPLYEVLTVAEDKKRDVNQSPAPGPGDPDWDRNRAVIHGEVDARDTSKGTGPVDDKEKGENK
jgi:hypothetical protein